MGVGIFVFFATILAIVNASQFRNATKDYCNINCGNQSTIHVMCDNSIRFPPSESCVGTEEAKSTITQVLQEQIVEKINYLRQKVAAGNETRGNPGPQPPAVFMPNVKWDQELAQIAKKMLNECRPDENGCIDVDDFPVLASTGDYIHLNDDKFGFHMFNGIIDKWYSGVDYIRKELVQDKPKKSLFYRDYVNIVSDTVKFVGCATRNYVISYPTGGEFPQQILVCLFGPIVQSDTTPVYIVRRNN